MGDHFAIRPLQEFQKMQKAFHLRLISGKLNNKKPTNFHIKSFYITYCVNMYNFYIKCVNIFLLLVY